MRVPPTVTGASSSPIDGLAGARRPDETRPDGQAELAQLLDVAHRRVHQDRRRAPDLDLRRQQLTDQRDRPRLRHRQDEHLARLDALDGGMHHQVVVLAAEDGAGRAGSSASGQELDQRQIDQTRPPRSLVDGRHAKLGQTRQLIFCHRLLTTQGSVRCKASACLTSSIPEIRRAWLPRRAASSV